jgi:prolyl oligopeptidase
MVEEVIHGVTVADPYRWLEEDSLPETREWIERQQECCHRYFTNCGYMDAIRTRVRAHLHREVVDQPIKQGNRYFYRRRDPEQEQACIYTRHSLHAVETQLVNPETLGRFASVGIYRVSEDGNLLAYEVRVGGEDRKAVHFLDVENGRPLPDNIESGYARGLVFGPANLGFYYCHERLSDARQHEILFHSFIEDKADQPVFRAERSRNSRLVLTGDGKHLGALWIHPQATGLVADFWVTPQDQPNAWRQVFANQRLPLVPILYEGRLFCLSYVSAPRGRLVEVDSRGIEIRIVIPEQETPIRQLTMSAGKVYTSHLRDFVQSVRIWTLSGQQVGEIELPDGGAVELVTQNNHENGLFYTYESFTQPTMTLEYLPDSGRSRVWHRTHQLLNGDPASVEQIIYPSSDGVQVAMTLVRVGNNRASSGSTPVLMSSYGGFGVPSTPQFSVLVTILLECGAVFALPHIRGGGELGNAWHEAARGRKRQTSFDDFLAAAKWLCREGVTSPQKLAIFGGSNSGLLVGAAMTQRPDLFRAVLCIAPLLDMIRYEQFDQATRWREEYGTVDNPEDFAALYCYSPYHRVCEATDYPAVMFVTGDKDDRCNPAHVRKMAARLKERAAQTHPILVDYSQERGHAPVMPLSVRTEALARRIAFLCRELDIPIDPGGVREPSVA